MFSSSSLWRSGCSPKGVEVSILLTGHTEQLTAFRLNRLWTTTLLPGSFVAGKELLDSAVEHFGIFKPLIDRSETNEGYLIDLLQTPHDNFSNRSAGDFRFPQKLNVALNNLYEPTKILTRNRTFFKRLLQTLSQLLA